MKVNDNNLQLVIQNKKFTPAQTDPKKDKWKFDAIVIDAGHGGKDYGAIGVNSTVEKTINLAVALKFGALVRQHLPDVRVIYTRDDDTFIELYRRGKIANENNGKLFISIHSNAVPGRSNSATGYEIYLLRPGRTDEAISIAARENSVISYEDNPNRYQKLTDENLILVSMAHASYMKYSEQFADLLDRHLSETVPLKSRGVKQAGFYVLVGASMPSVLFETGYVTNSKDADYLKSESGQDQLANALFQAVQSFKAYYTKEIEGE
jgi:N-acetylmuramoyl-L-alanine amidase